MITSSNPQIILASGSPRRLELMRALGFEPIVFKSDIPEECGPDEPALDYTQRLARQKAQAVAASINDDALPAWILSADTIVVLDGRVLEKPVDADDACAMLRALSGRAHEVITTFCWLDRRQPERHVVESVITKVYFKALSETWITRYVATQEPMDKAGAYGIQGLAGVFVERVEGSYSCVVGLPVTEVVAALDALGGLGPFPFLSETGAP